jgi:hypothetical protein
MRKLTSIILLVLFMALSSFASEEKKPAVWGKIYKTKESQHGYQYFVYFKKDGKDYAYPLSTNSNMSKKKLEELVGKYARIYGEEKFDEINLEGSKHILTFEVRDAIELTLADLNQNFDAYAERIDVKQLRKRQLESDQPTKKGLSDKAVNTAIFVGGAILAAEILSVLLAN